MQENYNANLVFVKSPSTAVQTQSQRFIISGCASARPTLLNLPWEYAPSYHLTLAQRT